MNTTLEEKTLNFVVTEIDFDEDYFILNLADGRILKVPYELVPSLARATKKQRLNCEIAGMGTSLYWPDLDEDLTVEGLVLGRRIIDWKKDIKVS